MKKKKKGKNWMEKSAIRAAGGGGVRRLTEKVMNNFHIFLDHLPYQSNFLYVISQVQTQILTKPNFRISTPIKLYKLKKAPAAK